MNKRIIAIVLLLILLPVHCFAQTAVFVNGDEAEFKNETLIMNDRTVIPMREMFEILGAEVEWLDSERVIIATKNNIIVVMKIGNYRLIRTDAETGENIVSILDIAPQLVNDITYIPLRAVAESFDARVEWDDINKAVNVFLDE